MAHILPNEVLSTCTNGFLYCFFNWADIVTGGLFGIMILLGFCFAIYIATIRFGTPRAFGFASFVGLIGSVWFATLQFIAWWIASVFIIIGIIGIVVMVMNEGG